MSEQPTNTPAGTEAQPASPATPQPTPQQPTSQANDGTRDAADAPLGEPGIKALREERAARERLEQAMKDQRTALLEAFGVKSDKPGEDIVKTLQQQVSAMQRDSLVDRMARRHGITDDDDVELLRAAPDEAAMGRLAGRLKAVSTTTPNTPAPDPSQAAASPTPEALEEQEFAAFYPPTGK